MSHRLVTAALLVPSHPEGALITSTQFIREISADIREHAATLSCMQTQGSAYSYVIDGNG